MVFLACVHLTLFLASSLSPGNSLVSSWCDHGILALTVSNSSLFTPALLRTHSFVFFAVHETRRICECPSRRNLPFTGKILQWSKYSAPMIPSGSETNNDRVFHKSGGQCQCQCQSWIYIAHKRKASNALKVEVPTPQVFKL